MLVGLSGHYLYTCCYTHVPTHCGVAARPNKGASYTLRTALIFPFSLFPFLPFRSCGRIWPWRHVHSNPTERFGECTARISRWKEPDAVVHSEYPGVYVVYVCSLAMILCWLKAIEYEYKPYEYVDFTFTDPALPTLFPPSSLIHPPFLHSVPMATLVVTMSLDAIKVYEGTCRPKRVIWGFRATKQMSKRGHSIRVLAHLIRQEIVFGCLIGGWAFLSYSVFSRLCVSYLKFGIINTVRLLTCGGGLCARCCDVQAVWTELPVVVSRLFYRFVISFFLITL